MPIVIEKTGSMVVVRDGDHYDRKSNYSGKVRGEVSGFSKKSQGRFRDYLATIDFEETQKKYGCAGWLTLTFDGKETGAEQAKRHLDYLVSKVIPRSGFDGPLVWKAELQKRGTVHFHILYFGLPEDQRNFISVKWHEITGSRQDKHLDYGVDLKKVESHLALKCYLSKYLTKEEGSAKRWDLGRVWGKRRAKGLVHFEVEERVVDLPFKKTMRALEKCGCPLPSKLYDGQEFLDYVESQVWFEVEKRVDFWEFRKIKKAARSDCFDVIDSAVQIADFEPIINFFKNSCENP